MSASDSDREKDRYLVLGNPIAHSRSPNIHRAFAAQTGQSMAYDLQLVELNQFASSLNQLRQDPNFKGCNVTLPFKLEALAYAQLHGGSISARAQLAGAVNTLKFEAGGRVLADNTDGVGLVNDISQRQGVKLQEVNVVLLGAGGAARGVILPLLDAGVRHIVLANRSLDKVHALIDSVRELAPQHHDKISGCALSEALAKPCDVLINATSSTFTEGNDSLTEQLRIGLAARSNALASLSLAYDMVYGARPTRFMAWAQGQGCGKVSDGLGMLVEQAAESFTLWRGVRPDANTVFSELRSMLSAPAQAAAVS